MDDVAERAALLTLLRTRKKGASWSDVTGDVIEAGSARALLQASQDLTLLGDPRLEQALAEAEAEVRDWGTASLRMLTVVDPDYPERLLGIHQAPPFIFVQGELRRDDPAVSVVGSRKASPLGLQIATKVASALPHDGITVVAGLAAGIDTAAHAAALEVGGRTVAVIGTGIRKTYPAGNKELQQVISERGLVISQFLPDAPPQPHNFPMRNITMSGYGIATVVVEAGEHSGARIQARVAVEHGRPVILTDLVVDQTAWGKEMLGRPDVHVASNTAEILDIVRLIRDRAESLQSDLSLLAGV